MIIYNLFNTISSSSVAKLTHTRDSVALLTVRRKINPRHLSLVFLSLVGNECCCMGLVAFKDFTFTLRINTSEIVSCRTYVKCLLCDHLG